MAFQPGDKNRRSKLTELQVASIKKEYLSGATQYALAEKYGVAQSAISKIMRGDRWSHTEDVSKALADRGPKDIDRFHSFYQIDESGCWVWQRSTLQPPHLPYGQFKAMRGDRKKNGTAHRWIYEHIHGPQPKTTFICHTCDNPSCVNPDHLYAGTPKQNSRDRDMRGRGIKPVGASNPMATLTENEVIEIRKMFADGMRVNEIARATGLKHQNVSKIVRRERWTHVA